MDKFSKDLLNDNKPFAAEKLNYTGGITMSYSHYHEHYEILYVSDGERKLVINNHDKYTLSHGTIALIKPFILHKTESMGGNERRILVNFSKETGTEIKRFANADLLKCFDAPIPELKDTNITKELLSELASLDRSDPFFEAKFKTKLAEVLTKISETAAFPFARRNGTEDIIPLIAKEIQEKYAEDITLSYLAEKFHINSCYLSRKFTKEMGITLVKYINTVRIIAAQKLFDNGCQSVTAAAIQTGFSSITHFERVFKGITGTAPKKYTGKR